MNISGPACIGSTVEASKVRKYRKMFAFKKFILPHCLHSATPPRPNERDPNSRAVKMHRKGEKKRREKEKRKEEKFGDLIAKKKKTEVREHRFFRGDPCAVTFHESSDTCCSYPRNQNRQFCCNFRTLPGNLPI